MEDKTRVDKLFDTFSNAIYSQRHHLFMINVKERKIRWTKNAVDFFGFDGDIMDDPYTQFIELVHPADRDDVKNLFAKIYAMHEGYLRCMFQMKQRNGKYLRTFIGCTLMDEEEDSNIYAGEIEVVGMVDRFDSSTAFWTTAVLLERIEVLKEERIPFSLLCIGIHNFREINEIYGFEFGDHIIESFGNRLLNGAFGCTVFRGHGVQFFILSSKLEPEDMITMYHTFKDYFKRNFTVKEHDISLEIGGSFIHYDDFDEEIDIDSIHSALEHSLRTSKTKRQGELVCCNSEQISEVCGSLKLISHLRKKIKEGCKDFYMVYQPVINKEDLSIAGAEALVRFESDEIGFVSPGRFIPMLETDQVFYDLSNWILKTALTQIKPILTSNEDFILNVNLSYAQLLHDDFEITLQAILEEVDYPPTNLCLELTERCRLIDPALLEERLLFIKSLGIKLALDDFGTGYSSLTLLQKYPINCIKLDRCTVLDVEDSFVTKNLVRSISDMTSRMGVCTVVEGIETESMLACLQPLNITKYQGFYFAKPMVIDGIFEYLNKRHVNAMLD